MRAGVGARQDQISTSSTPIEQRKTRETYLTRCDALAQLLRHKPILDIRKLRTLREMVLWQEHVPNAQGMGFLLQIIEDRRVAVPAGISRADLRRVDDVGGDTFFVDEGVDLGNM